MQLVFKIIMIKIIFVLLVLMPYQHSLAQQPEIASGDISEPTTESATAQRELATLIESLTEAVDYLGRLEARDGFAGGLAREGIELQREDLEAQSSMSLSTMIMALVSVPSLVIAIVGVYMLAKTLRYTRNASNHAAETLRIAQDTLEESRLNSQRELRAYIAIKTMSAKDKRVWRDTFCLGIQMVNLGQTPANNVRFYYKFFMPKKEFTAQSCPDPSKSIKGYTEGVLGPMNKDDDTFIPLASSIGRQPNSSDFPLYCIGVINYEDVFDKKRTTYFCSQIIPSTLDLVHLSFGNKLT